MSKLLTLKEIATELGVPESTVRKYREKFSSFIPSVGSGRSMRYRGEAVAVFQDIRHQREDMQMPWDAISDQLSGKYPMDATSVSGGPMSNVRQPSQVPLVLSDQPEGEAGYAPPPPQPQRAQAVPQVSVARPAQHVNPGGDVAAVMKRASAIGEKQMMLVNAIAIEMLRAIDGVKADSAKQARHAQLNFQNTFSAMLKTLTDVSRDEKALLGSINRKLDDLCRATVAASSAAQAQAKAANPVADAALARMAEMESQLAEVTKKLTHRDKLLVEYKNTLESVKRENTDLKTFKKRQETILASQKEELDDPGPKRPRKRSALSKIFGSKD